MSNRVRLAVLAYTNLIHAELVSGTKADPEVKAKLLAAMQPDYPCTPSQLPSARCQETGR